MSAPNVLLICVDHWPGPLLGAAGHERILTPTLDQFCRDGVHFTNAYSEAPTCIPARRALMTGTTAKTHGDRVFNETLRMPPHLSTMPQVFREAGYQAYAVGKLHVYPQRSRIGFDEVILNEEGRHHLGLREDDFELFLSREGYRGQELTHAMGNNEYTVRPWHLPEYCHPTNWTTREMCHVIQRRDPDRPAFWYCSYIAPHPPVTPPREYLDLYTRFGVDEPFVADWAANAEIPYALKVHRSYKPGPPTPELVSYARIGFYAQCTYIDHQLRLLVGTLREEGLLDDTVIMVVCDHGDMLGNHNLWAKPPMFEYSAKIPMILVPAANRCRSPGVQDQRLAELRDVMPTLLDLCDISVPETVEGHSLVSEVCRDYLYCEHYEDKRAMRMVRKGKYKLIYYPTGNRFQLFDIAKDPQEMTDLTDNQSLIDVKTELAALLLQHLHGGDLAWVSGNELIGMPDEPVGYQSNRGLSGQRGWR